VIDLHSLNASTKGSVNGQSILERQRKKFKQKKLKRKKNNNK